MVNLFSRPEIWSLGASMKGLSLTDPSDWGLPWDSEDVAQSFSAVDAYHKSAWFRRCVDVRAQGVGGIPWGIYRVGGEEPIWTDVTEPPSGMEWLDVQDILRRTETALLVSRAAYWFREGTETRTSALVWYNPETVKPHLTPQGIDYFERRINSTTYHLDPAFVAYIFEQDAWTEQGPPATGVGDAAAEHARVLTDLTGYTSEQLRSGLVKRAVWVAKGRRPNDDEVERAESWLSRFLQGRGKEKAKILSGEIEPKVIGSDLSDLSEQAITEEHQKAIATALGVPHSVVMSSAATYATAVADQLGFYVFTLVPRAEYIATKMVNRQILTAMGLELRVEPSRAEVMQATEVQKAQSLVPLVAGGILTEDEARESLGYGPKALAAPVDAEIEIPDDGEDEDEDEASMEDVRRWRSKVEKRGRTVKFSPDALSDGEASVIRERLVTGKSLDEAFSPPFASF